MSHRLAAGSLLLTLACTSETAEVSSQSLEQSEQLVQQSERAEALGQKAVTELRDKIRGGVEVDFELALDQCVFWPDIEGFYLVVYNPIIYRYQEDGEILEFFPFIPPTPNTEILTVMNGPYRYGLTDEDHGFKVVVDDIGSADDAIMFTLEYSEILSLGQGDKQEMFTPAWAYTSDEVPIIETHIVAESDIERAMRDICGLEPVIDDGTSTT